MNGCKLVDGDFVTQADAESGGQSAGVCRAEAEA